MSPTILELVVLVVLIVVAWQIGVLVAPSILRELRNMRDTIDEIDHDISDGREKDDNDTP